MILGKIITAVAIACGVILIAMAVASAQPISCGPYESIRAHLMQNFAEAPIAIAALDSGARGTLIVFAASGGQTWSVVIRGQNDRTCLVASGVSWRVIASPNGEASP